MTKAIETNGKPELRWVTDEVPATNGYRAGGQTGLVDAFGQNI